jgi:peptide/nickel transport system substrate-binding protein
MAVVLAACGGTSAVKGTSATTAPATRAPGATANGHAPKLVSVDGGTVTMAVDAVPSSLNDHTVTGDTAAARAVASMVWGQVFQVAPRSATKLDTDVVDSAEVVSVAPQTVVYQIDPKATWSDGTPVTAQDFVYAWLAQNGSGHDLDGTPDSVASTLGYRDIASVVGSDNGKTVTVVFQTPYADWSSLFADLLPAHVAERVGWNAGFDHFDPGALVSAGPWVVSAWDPGRKIVLSRNPHWWGTAPHLDQVVLTALPGAPAVAAALRAGAVQVGGPAAFDSSFLASVTSSPALQSQVSLGATMVQLVFNTRRAPLDATVVRQGIAHGIDRASLVTRLVQPLAPLVWEDNDHLFANMQPWYTDDAGGASGYVEPDPAAAARSLAAGGLVADPHGTWTLRGAPVTLTLVWAADDPWSALVGPAVAAQLVDTGFTVAAQPVPAAQLQGDILPRGAFDLALLPLAAESFPSHLAASFGTGPVSAAAVGTGASRDWSGFDDPRVDALFTEASQQLAADQDRALYQQVDTALWSAMPTLPLFAEPTVVVWSVDLASVRDDPGGLGPLWSVDQWAELIGEGTHRSSAHTAEPG